MAGVAAEVLRGAAPSDPTAVRLVLLTSEWSDPIAEYLYPQLDALVAAAGARGRSIERLELCRGDSDGHTNLADGWSRSAIDAESFRAVCREAGVTELPACIFVESTGSVLDAQLLTMFLDAELSGDNEAANSKLATAASQLARGGKASAGVEPWWIKLLTDPGTDNILTARPSSDPEIVQMREQTNDLFENGDLVSAAKGFARVLVQSPRCTKSSFNLAVILHMLGETYFAVAFMLRVVAIDDSDAVAHTVLRTVYYPDEPDRVVAGYRAIITASPDHVRAVHSLATLEGDAVTAAPQYVREVFDELADSFEEKLVTHLDYRVPWQLVDALSSLAPDGFADTESPSWTAADLGCGTGLCGRLLRPRVKHLIGVDISPLMIDKTRESGVYDDLLTADIAPFLVSCTDASLDLVISADVWIYVGALDAVFPLCATKLKRSTGWLAFSIELLPEHADEPFRLASSGRFQHSHEYIAKLASASGFTIGLHQDVAVRKESGQPVPGRIYVLQLTTDA